jgi:hypothetical protein
MVAENSQRRRARPNFLQREPERAMRQVMPLEEFEMTEEEWRAMGGSPEPMDHNPDRRRRTTGSSPWCVQGAEVPAMQDVWPIVQGIAERLGVFALSIRWPNPHDRLIRAEPLP